MSHYDPIVEEIHRVRREYSAQFNGDLDAMFADILTKQEELKKQGYKFVTLPPRCAPPAPAAVDVSHSMLAADAPTPK